MSPDACLCHEISPIYPPWDLYPSNQTTRIPLMALSHWMCSEMAPIGINRRITGVSRRGDEGGAARGGPLWLPVVPSRSCVRGRMPAPSCSLMTPFVTRSRLHARDLTLPPGDHKGPPNLPSSSLAPTRDPSPRRLLCLLLLRLIRIGTWKWEGRLHGISRAATTSARPR